MKNPSALLVIGVAALVAAFVSENGGSANTPKLTPGNSMDETLNFPWKHSAPAQPFVDDAPTFFDAWLTPPNEPTPPQVLPAENKNLTPQGELEPAVPVPGVHTPLAKADASAEAKADKPKQAAKPSEAKAQAKPAPQANAAEKQPEVAGGVLGMTEPRESAEKRSYPSPVQKASVQAAQKPVAAKQAQPVVREQPVQYRTYCSGGTCRRVPVQQYEWRPLLPLFR